MGFCVLLGGTFDPIHLGHVEMALSVMRLTGCEELWILPDGDPPHKGRLAPAKDRMAMAELAVSGYTGMSVCDLELNRKGITYTVDTLTELRRSFPDKEYCYIIGADTLMVLETWKDFSRVAAMLNSMIAIPRAGSDPDACSRQIDHLKNQYGLDVILLPDAVRPVSSSEIRRRIARHLPIDDMVCPEVSSYIQTHKLYRDPMLEEIIRTMSPSRYVHTLGVEACAVRMANRFGDDPAKASLAALLHDCAKFMDVKEMCKLVDRQGIKTGKGERASRALLHAAAGVAMAKEKFGISDEDVLNAIRWHTTGHANMTRLEKIIYLADMIEPNRREFSGLSTIRAAAEQDLDEAMRQVLSRLCEETQHAVERTDPGIVKQS